MAAAHTPLHEAQESKVSTARQIGPSPVIHATRADERTINALLTVILLAMVIFPFAVRFLPVAIVQHLDVLFR
jgi:hypothetical protein